jgi:glutaredoxin 3
MQKKLSHLNAEVWSQTNCPACTEAKRLLEQRAIKYTECMLGINGYSKKELMAKVPNARSVPQIFLDGELIGGLHELKKRLLEHDNNQKAELE